MHKVITSSGRWIDLADIKLDDVQVIDIARSLTNMCRFNGHLRQPYSVAAHSLAVMQISPKGLKPFALIHDAAEAYISDIIRPLKVGLGWKGRPIYELEFQILALIAEKFGVTLSNNEIKRYDDAVLGAEFILLRNFSGVTPNGERFHPTISAIKAVTHYSSLPYDEVFNEFLTELNKLLKKKGA